MTGGGTTSPYRLYWIGADGHIKWGEFVECASDEEARTVAIARKGDYPAMEVWLGTRRVVRIGTTERPEEE